MSSKHTTAKAAKALRTTGRAAKGLSRGTARGTRFAITHWRGLLPLLCVGAAGVYTIAAELFAWAYGPRAWFWMVLVGMILFVWVDGWVGTLPRPIRPPAIAFVLFTIAAAVAFITAASRIETWLTVGVVTLALGTWWWNGTAYQSHKTTERGRRKMENILHGLGITDATRVSSVSTTEAGDIEWRLYLGDKDRIAQIKPEDLAHMLKVDTSRVLVRRAEKGTTRNVKIVLLAAALGKAKSVVHPAQGASGEWEPGARSIDQGAPIGPTMADPEKIATVYSYKRGYGAFHKLVAGTTGSGKSVTVRSIAAHAVASDDAALAGVDLVKGGASLLPFKKAMASLVYLPLDKANDDQAFLAAARELLADVQWLRSEVSVRTAQMASGEVLGEDGEITDVWPASPQTPVIEYVFEEYAATMRKIYDLDADLGEQIEEACNGVAETARSSGISLDIVNQRPTTDAVPANLRGNLNQVLLHKLNNKNDQGKVWSQYDVDAVNLPLGKGLVYIGDPDNSAPDLSKAYDLSKPKVCAAIAKAYAACRPQINWRGAHTAEDAQQGPQAAPAAPVAAQPVDGAIALMREAAEAGDDIPAGVGIIGGAAEPREGDDERLAVILKALAASEAGLRRAEIETALKEAGLVSAGTAKEAAASKSTTLRLLNVLQDEDKVIRDGAGRGSVYRIDTDALTGAAA